MNVLALHEYQSLEEIVWSFATAFGVVKSALGNG